VLIGPTTKTKQNKLLYRLASPENVATFSALGIVQAGSEAK
jgi:hypothetical protein